MKPRLSEVSQTGHLLSLAEGFAIRFILTLSGSHYLGISFVFCSTWWFPVLHSSDLYHTNKLGIVNAIKKKSPMNTFL